MTPEDLTDIRAFVAATHDRWQGDADQAREYICLLLLDRDRLLQPWQANEWRWGFTRFETGQPTKSATIVEDGREVASGLTGEQAVAICRQHNLPLHAMDELDSNGEQWTDQQMELFL